MLVMRNESKIKKGGGGDMIKNLKNNIYAQFSCKLVKIIGLSFALFFLIKNFF